MFRVEGATRGQVFLRGLCMWLAASAIFFPFNTANRHWPQLFADRTLFTCAVLALTLELLAVRNFQHTFGGFNWISAACVPLGMSAALFGLLMSGAILSVLYDHMTSRYDTLSMVVVVLLGIAVLPAFSVCVGRRESTLGWRSPLSVSSSPARCCSTP
jgi:hypothetical protein